MSNFILPTNDNLGKAEKHEEGKMHPSATLRDEFSVGNLATGSWKLLTPPHTTSQVARKPLLPSLPPSSHQCQPHLVPEWITGGCMIMGTSLKLDLSCHICPRHYHLTLLERLHLTEGHSVGLLTLRSVLRCFHTIQSRVLRYCEFLIYPHDNLPSWS